MTSNYILDGHKRVGKRLVPPMMQLPGMKDISYIDVMLPELIWLGLINDNLGFVRGARFFEKMVLAAMEVAADPPHKNYAIISQLGTLNVEQRDSFLQSLSNDEMLEPLRNHIAPLILLYDQCPLAFIGPPDTVYSQNDLIRSIKSCVDRHLDKFETPGIVLNGAMLLARLVAGTIKFSKDMDLPDFNSVIDAPESDEARHAAGFMRASAIGEFGMSTIDDAWARHFWNRNFEISDCEFDYGTSAEE